MKRWRIARLVAGKDLRIERRSRVVVNQVLPFAAVTMLMFAFALDATDVLERVAPGLVWLATLFSLLSVTVGATLGAASVMSVFSEVGRGSAGIEAMVNGMTGAIRPVLYALATFCLCAVAIAAMLFRAQPGTHTDPAEARPSMSTGTAAFCAALLCLVVVAADQLLRLNHHAMGWLLAILGPPKPGITGRMLMEDESIIYLFFWGLVCLP